MAWDRQQVQEAHKKEKHWMTFMRDMFSMFVAPPMPQPYYPMLDHMPSPIAHGYTSA